VVLGIAVRGVELTHGGKFGALMQGVRQGGGEQGTEMKIMCMLVKYCNATCQRKHWSKHKKPCKIRAAELRDEALFKDPPPKEECPICFLPMPVLVLSCISLPDASLSSIPIYDFANEHVELANEGMETYKHL
jgi:hypothetical protein